MCRPRRRQHDAFTGARGRAVEEQAVLRRRRGRPPELVVRPQATEADILAAIEHHRPWFERELARLPEPQLGLDRLTLTEAQGRCEAHARISLLAQSEAMALGVRYTHIALR